MSAPTFLLSQIDQRNAVSVGHIIEHESVELTFVAIDPQSPYPGERDRKILQTNEGDFKLSVSPSVAQSYQLGSRYRLVPIEDLP